MQRGPGGGVGWCPPTRPMNVGQNMGRRARGRALTPPCIPRVPCRCGPLYYTYDSAAAPATLIPLHAHLSSPCRLCTMYPWSLSLSTVSFVLIMNVDSVTIIIMCLLPNYRDVFTLPKLNRHIEVCRSKWWNKLYGPCMSTFVPDKTTLWYFYYIESLNHSATM